MEKETFMKAELILKNVKNLNSDFVTTAIFNILKFEPSFSIFLIDEDEGRRLLLECAAAKYKNMV
jgi:hypothetical protein